MRAQNPQPAGRDHEMSALRSAVTACAAGASIVVDITGDPGLGKSTLLAELSKLAQAKGLAVVTDPSPAFENGLGSVAELVAEADRGTGVLLCLDDLHSAGDHTLTLLHELLRRPPGTPLILACGHRPRQSPARLLASLLHPAPHYRVVRLPLGDGEGNPFYLRLLGELATSTGLSEFARAALIRETATLSGDELAVLRAASVLGDPFDPLLLAAVADLPDQRALDALDGLAAADLVRAADSRLLRSRHPGLREAVVRDTPPGWALAAHRRADLALRDSGADAVARAPHVARSARVGDAEAVAVLVAAARRSRHLSPGDAATWLRAGLRLSASPSFDMLLGLAEAVAMTGDLGGCLDSLRQALDLVPPDRPELRVPAVALGAAARRVLAAESCSLDLERELASWSRSDPRADPLRAQLAIMLTAQGKYDDSLLSDGVPTACRALAAAYRGRRETFPAHFDSLTDDELAAGLDEVAQFGWAEALSERHHDALRHAGRGVAVARRTGQAHLLPYLLLCRSYSQQATGDLAGGAASAAAAQQAAHRLTLPKLAAFASTLQAAAAARRPPRRRGRRRRAGLACLRPTRTALGGVGRHAGRAAAGSGASR
ncbi:ATP-binding protein [Kutzneria sp. 744]|uniref:ATP-binding protein n=1 Tax=Kutzneria sp. (strain 744) TaxID=345341 RepID=UPI0003EEDE7F|nr:ATP-binding protein [Kutzneria sp. 744]EWM09987.1 LigA protein [Kutzneria sp. 744]